MTPEATATQHRQQDPALPTGADYDEAARTKRSVPQVIADRARTEFTALTLPVEVAALEQKKADLAAEAAKIRDEQQALESAVHEWQRLIRAEAELKDSVQRMESDYSAALAFPARLRACLDENAGNPLPFDACAVAKNIANAEAVIPILQQVTETLRGKYLAHLAAVKAFAIANNVPRDHWPANTALLDKPKP